MRYWEDTALALYGRGRPAEALRALLAAEHVAPQEVRNVPWARDLTTNLLAGPNQGHRTELRNLASRVGVH